jgi:hypothetical protein
MQNLFKIASVYNPYFIQVPAIGGKTYRLKGIYIYKKDGVIIKERAWFGNNNNRTQFTIPTATRRLKPKLDGTTFIVPVKKEYYELRDKEPHAILYIPFDYFDFEKFTEVDKFGEEIRHYPKYVSRTRFMDDNDSVPLTVVDREHGVVEIDKAVKRKIDSLKAKKEKLEKELKRIDEAYSSTRFGGGKCKGRGWHNHPVEHRRAKLRSLHRRLLIKEARSMLP